MREMIDITLKYYTKALGENDAQPSGGDIGAIQKSGLKVSDVALALDNYLHSPHGKAPSFDVWLTGLAPLWLHLTELRRG